jgi:ankyrin repeat protein
LASYNGHSKVVELLLKDKRVDPSDCDNDAIKWASKNGHLEIVKLLSEDKRVNPRDYKK